MIRVQQLQPDHHDHPTKARQIVRTNLGGSVGAKRAEVPRVVVDEGSEVWKFPRRYRFQSRRVRSPLLLAGIGDPLAGAPCVP